MKVYGKWLIKATGSNLIVNYGIAASFRTKKEAEEMLDTLFTREDDHWISDLGIEYRIEKNTKEYR